MTDSKHKADPQIASILKRLEARAREVFAHWNRGGLRPRQVQDRRMPGAFGSSRLRIYTPDTSPDRSLDAIRNDSIKLHQRLQHAGIENSLTVYPTVIHGFTLSLGELDCAHRTVTEAASWLRNQAGLQPQANKVSSHLGSLNS